MNAQEIAELWIANGGSRATAAAAAACALAESSGNPNAVSSTDDWGLWQINGGGRALLDPAANARRAIAMSSNGQNWRPWCTAYTDGACGTKGGKYDPFGASPMGGEWRAMGGAVGGTPDDGGRTRGGGEPVDDGGGGGITGFLGDVAGGIFKYDPFLGGGVGFAFGAGSGVMGALSHVPVIGGLFSSIHAIQVGVETFLGKVLWLFDPLNWLRMVEFVFGGALILYAIGMLGRAVASADSGAGRAAEKAGEAGAAIATAPKTVAELAVTKGRSRKRKAIRRARRAPKSADRRHLTERQLDYRVRRRREG